MSRLSFIGTELAMSSCYLGETSAPEILGEFRSILMLDS